MTTSDHLRGYRPYVVRAPGLAPLREDQQSSQDKRARRICLRSNELTQSGETVQWLRHLARTIHTVC